MHSIAICTQSFWCLQSTWRTTTPLLSHSREYLGVVLNSLKLMVSLSELWWTLLQQAVYKLQRGMLMTALTSTGDAVHEMPVTVMTSLCSDARSYKYHLKIVLTLGWITVFSSICYVFKDSPLWVQCRALGRQYVELNPLTNWHNNLLKAVYLNLQKGKVRPAYLLKLAENLWLWT